MPAAAVAAVVVAAIVGKGRATTVFAIELIVPDLPGSGSVVWSVAALLAAVGAVVAGRRPGRGRPTMLGVAGVALGVGAAGAEWGLVGGLVNTLPALSLGWWLAAWTPLLALLVAPFAVGTRPATAAAALVSAGIVLAALRPTPYYGESALGFIGRIGNPIGIDLADAHVPVLFVGASIAVVAALWARRWWAALAGAAALAGWIGAGDVSGAVLVVLTALWAGAITVQLCEGPGGPSSSKPISSTSHQNSPRPDRRSG